MYGQVYGTKELYKGVQGDSIRGIWVRSRDLIQ